MVPVVTVQQLFHAPECVEVDAEYAGHVLGIFTGVKAHNDSVPYVLLVAVLFLTVCILDLQISICMSM